MTDLDRLTAENHKLKVENWRLRMQMDTEAINAAAKKIEADILAQEPAGSTFDWESLTVKGPDATTE